MSDKPLPNSEDSFKSLGNGARKTLAYLLHLHAKRTPRDHEMQRAKRLETFEFWFTAKEIADAFDCTCRAVEKWRAELAAAGILERCTDNGGKREWWIDLPSGTGELTRLPMHPDVLTLAPNVWRAWAVLYGRRNRKAKTRGWKPTITGLARLSAEMGCSGRPATAHAAIAELKRRGLVKVDQRGLRRSNRTWLAELPTDGFAVAPVELCRDPVADSLRAHGIVPNFADERNRKSEANETVNQTERNRKSEANQTVNYPESMSEGLMSGVLCRKRRAENQRSAADRSPQPDLLESENRETVREISNRAVANELVENGTAPDIESAWNMLLGMTPEEIAELKESLQ